MHFILHTVGSLSVTLTCLQACAWSCPSLLGFDWRCHHCQRLCLAWWHGASWVERPRQRSQGTGCRGVRVVDGHTADDVCALAQTNTVQTDEQCYFIRKRDRYIRVIWSDNFGIANIGVAMLHILRVQSSGSVSNPEKTKTKQELRRAAYPHLAGWNLRSSSVSVSLWMVMMLTAGLGVSEMMIGWDNVALALGGVTPLLLSNDAVDIPLDREKGKKKKS